MDIFDDRPGENYVGSPAMERIRDRLREERIDFQRRPFDRSPMAADLCSSLLCLNPDERPIAEEAMRHPWLMADAGARRWSSERSSKRSKKRSSASRWYSERSSASQGSL